MTFSAKNLPKGLTLNKSTGIISGVAPSVGEYKVKLTAKNKKGSSIREFKIVSGDTLALTPPMGWNHWYAHYDRVTDKMVREAADAMVDSGMFVESDLKIVAQIVLPIRFCLVGSCKMNEIQRLYAHPQAVGQCRFWIQNNLPKAELIETSSNARSAEIVAQAVHRKGGQRPRIAAITGFLAAEKYDVNVIACDIQDLTTNATRFLVLGRQCSPATGHGVGQGFGAEAFH